ncbi:MAG: hypothetical protein JXA21_23700 [Anaerolineae bacterium]|nr:hypothetical protein [Anaerolineae bacterium]
MPAYRKASIRELTRSAYQLNGRFVEGILHQNSNNEWMIGDTLLSQWVARHESENVTMILLSMDEKQEIEETTCRTCGRRYVGVECPYCRETRLRLRGRE